LAAPNNEYQKREKRDKNVLLCGCLFCVLTTSFVIVLVLTTFHYPKLINHQKQQDFETAKLTDFGLARILPQYANDRRDVNPKTTPKIGPPKYRAPEVEKHDSEKDHTYAFSSDVYGYGVMCFQLIDQVKKGDGNRIRTRLISSPVWATRAARKIRELDDGGDVPGEMSRVFRRVVDGERQSVGESESDRTSRILDDGDDGRRDV